ncbi:hypothetical protein QR680_004167 [Steinernema hermaphroditum]|uniref:Phospholipase A2 domain-containing protein n=1 Tax=Steinernema hermaphroditum TaxID=289476 RepID=A0AA39HMU8_9BILA|nr:hypothetical protein QR680_004167 [Steinernema hermaphroditum]
MKIQLLAALSATVLLAACVESVDPSNFQCGTEKHLNKVIYKIVDKLCPVHIDSINDCCVEHDACYDNTTRITREECDTKFCTCLTDATSSNPTCQCQALETTMCKAVEFFGGPAYRIARAKVTYVNPVFRKGKEIWNSGKEIGKKIWNKMSG